MLGLEIMTARAESRHNDCLILMKVSSDRAIVINGQSKGSAVQSHSQMNDATCSACSLSICALSSASVLLDEKLRAQRV